jgi:hypothetical protein
MDHPSWEFFLRSAGNDARGGRDLRTIPGVLVARRWRREQGALTVPTAATEVPFDLPEVK